MGAGAARKKPGRPTLKADETWSFVGSRADAWRIRVASDAEARRVAAMDAGDRSESTARCLRDALPDERRSGATAYSDFGAAYAAAVPGPRHVPCSKGDGLTCRVERSWCTVRQRCSRFVRKAPSISRCDLDHTGALWYFIRHYNASLR